MMTAAGESMSRDFYYLLHKALQANCPRDTHNMVSHITLTDMGDYWEINISGPNKGYDYARAVNERQGMVKSGPNKGANNYKWVERTIKQVCNALGEEVNYELS